jgi:hypothetical protein
LHFSWELLSFSFSITFTEWLCLILMLCKILNYRILRSTCAWHSAATWQLSGAVIVFWKIWVLLIQFSSSTLCCMAPCCLYAIFLSLEVYRFLRRDNMSSDVARWVHLQSHSQTTHTVPPILSHSTITTQCPSLLSTRTCSPRRSEIDMAWV